jgi:ribosomal protein L9
MSSTNTNICNNLMSEKIESLALALSKAQSNIENVAKDKQAYGYKYADLASCLDAVKKPLGDNGLSISQLVSQEGEKHVLITMLLHESGQWLRSMFSIENVVMKQCNSLQQLGAGITYARRYALSAMIGLTQEDDDAQGLGKDKHKEEIRELKQREEAKELKEQVTQQAMQDLSLTRELMALCRDAGINVKEFAKFAGVDSNKLETVKNAIEHFESLKEAFMEVNRDAA